MEADQSSVDRRDGVHAERDINVEGDANQIAGRNIVHAGIYVDNVEIASFHQAGQVGLAQLRLLPRDVADFTGRAGEIAELEAALLARGGQAVVVSAVAGKPGVGKSALAIHVGHRLSERFPDGQVYVNLRGADRQPLSPETALTELLQVLGTMGDQQPVSLDAKAALWRQHFADRRVLLLVDDARDEAQVRPLLPGSATCAVIVTSRAVLATLGAKPLLLDILDAGEALELLSKIAGAGRIDAEPEAARAVVSACGGLPLALRIAGARLLARADWRVAKLADRLTDERRRLTELGLSDLDVRASFQLSYQDLDVDQAELFCLLGLWPGLEFSPWVAAALLGVDEQEAEELLDGLVTAQLLMAVQIVEPAPVTGRYRLHDLLRLFAREQLARDHPNVDQVATTDRLVWVAAQLAYFAFVALMPPGSRKDVEEDAKVEPQVALAWLEVEREGLVALVGAAAERGPWAAAWLLAKELDGYLSRWGYWADLERVQRWALFAARQAGDRAAEAGALGALGTVLGNLGRWQQATDHHQQSLVIMRELDDRQGQADTFINLGVILADQRQWEEATNHYQQALPIYRELGDRSGQATTLTNLGVILGAQSRWEEATDHYQQALPIYRELGDRSGQAATLTNLGVILGDQGRWDEATNDLQQALTILGQLGDRRIQGRALLHLGVVLADQGRWEEANDHYQRALLIQRDLGDRYGQVQTLTSLGDVLVKQGHWRQASDRFELALSICRELGDRSGQAETLTSLGRVLGDQGRWEEATDPYQQALPIYRELGDRSGQATTLANLGVILGDQGRWEEATDHLQRALEVFSELGDRTAEAQTLNNVGVVLADQGRWEEANDYYQRALPILRDLGNRHGEAQTLTNVGNVLAHRSDWQSAIDHHQNALEVMRELGDRYGEAQVLTNLGSTLADAGNEERADEHWLAALAIFEDLEAPLAEHVRANLEHSDRGGGRH